MVKSEVPTVRLKSDATVWDRRKSFIHSSTSNLFSQGGCSIASGNHDFGQFGHLLQCYNAVLDESKTLGPQHLCHISISIGTDRFHEFRFYRCMR